MLGLAVLMREKNVHFFLEISKFSQNYLLILPFSKNLYLSCFRNIFLCFTVTKFLIETGSLLHYSDQLGALNTLYFLDPAWLCDILVKVFTVTNF